MLSKYNAVRDFVIASKAAMRSGGPEWNRLQASQVSHLISTIRVMAVQMEDASSLLQTLAVDSSGAFSPEQREELAAVVTQQVSGATDCPDQTTATRTGSQTHLYMYNYLTGDDWAKLESPTVPTADKYELLIQRAFSVGLTFPTELTCVAMVSIVIVVSKLTVTAPEAYRMLQDFKAILLNKRAAGHPAQTMRRFPQQVSEFMTKWPGRYEMCSPPVASPVPTHRFEEKRKRLPARKTHRGLSIEDRASRTEAAQSGPQALMAMMAEAFFRGMPVPRQQEPTITLTPSSAHNGEAARSTTPPMAVPPISAPGSGSQVDSALALQDGSLIDSPAPVIAEGEQPNVNTGIDIDAMMRSMAEALNEKKAVSKAKAKAKAKAKTAAEGTTEIEAGAKAKAKAKAKAGASAKSKAKAKGKIAKAKTETTGKRKDDDAPKKGLKCALMLGCGKCRGSHSGCGQCRDASFCGARWQR